MAINASGSTILHLHLEINSAQKNVCFNRFGYYGTLRRLKSQCLGVPLKTLAS